MSKDTLEVQKSKGFDDNFLKNFKFDKDSVVNVHEDKLNSYGFDLTNPDIIKYEDGNIEFEVTEGFNNGSLGSLKVSLRIQKKFNTSAVEVYRGQSIDLFHDNQLEFTIRQASEKIRVESTRMKEAVYALVQKLEAYRRERMYASKEADAPKSSNKAVKDVKDFLKAPNLEQNLRALLERSGIPDGRLGLKLFILSLSRLTDRPLHTILQGSVLLSHEVCKLFSQVIPSEQLKEATSLSPTALGHAPYPNYWNKKLLILHQLDGTLSKKDSTLEEYMMNDHLSRFVTEQNQKTGAYKANQKTNSDQFAVLGYTSRDFHKVFASSNVVCLTIDKKDEIKDKLNEWELKSHAGLVDETELENSILHLQLIQRVLEPIKVVNPYIDQVDFQKFFGNDVKKIRQFMQLTNLVVMLHKFQLNPKKKSGELYYEVESQHMLMVLDLFKELWFVNYDKLYFEVQNTLKKIKEAVKKTHQGELSDAMFTEKEIQKELKIAPSTLNKHMRTLTLNNKVERVLGNNRMGFYYCIPKWDEDEVEQDNYQHLTMQIRNLSNSQVSRA
jgi:hypothetical protein